MLAKLLALTGEGLTLKLHELDPMIEILEPTWIVPMHYGLAPVIGLRRRISTLDVFLNRRRNDPVIYERKSSVTFPLPKSDLGRPTIVVLEPSGYEPA